jgi:hypothetical protein
MLARRPAFCGVFYFVDGDQSLAGSGLFAVGFNTPPLAAEWLTGAVAFRKRFSFFGSAWNAI